MTAGIPTAELVQVLWSSFCALSNVGETIRSERFLNESRLKGDAPSLLYMAGLYFYLQLVFLAIQVVSVVTGIYVINWRVDNGFLVSLAPAMVRDSTIMFTSLLLGLVSYYGPVARRKLVSYWNAEDQRKAVELPQSDT